MKRSLFLFSLISLFFVSSAQAQKKRRPPVTNNKTPSSQTTKGNVNQAIVVDERLAVLRTAPSLYAQPFQRMRTGRTVVISASREADGVTFYRVSVPPDNYGWVQAEAVYGKFRRGDDERLARLVQATDGYEQVERAQMFLELFPSSVLRPAILLLAGDAIEEAAARISMEANRRLDRREMMASGAPVHSFFLNYVALDRYRKLGVNFAFNPNTKNFHYDGKYWREIIEKFAQAGEVSEARKRLDSLKEKMEKKP